MANFLVFIAKNGFRDEEYFDTKEALIQASHKVTTLSDASEATGKLGGSAHVDVLLDACAESDYDAVVFVGGPGSYDYFENPAVLKLARDFFANNKITSAICAAPTILANAGLLQGKNFTCFEGQKDYIESQGGHYLNEPVVRDGLIVTSQGPKTARAFGQSLSKLV